MLSLQYARSLSHSSIYYQLPSHGLPVTWSFNEDGTVDAEKYITELFAAKDKVSIA